MVGLVKTKVLELGDEFHYVMTCSALSSERNIYIPFYFRNRCNTLKFYELFSVNKLSVLNNLCKFIKIINKRVSPPG